MGSSVVAQFYRDSRESPTQKFVSGSLSLRVIMNFIAALRGLRNMPQRVTPKKVIDVGRKSFYDRPIALRWLLRSSVQREW
jgi:hypothetical protein